MKAHGFSLLEVMISAALTVCFGSAFWVCYQSQQNTCLQQLATAAMQQDLRTVMIMLEEDLRLAGYEGSAGRAASERPGSHGGGGPRPGILRAEPKGLQLTMDLDGDGLCQGANEWVEYVFETRNDSIGELRRKASINDNLQGLIHHVEALDLVYLDASGQELRPADAKAVPASRLNEIRSIEVLLVVRSALDDSFQRDLPAVYNLRGEMVLPGNRAKYQRSYLAKHIFCRNLESKFLEDSP